MGPYSIVEQIGAAAYRFDSSAELSDLHNVFHVSILRKVVRVPEFILHQPQNGLGKNWLHHVSQ